MLLDCITDTSVALSDSCHAFLSLLLAAGMRVVDAEYKLQKNIKIAMLYLEDDDAVNAETFIKKAATLITGTKVLLPFFASLLAV